MFSAGPRIRAGSDSLRLMPLDENRVTQAQVAATATIGQSPGQESEQKRLALWLTLKCRLFPRPTDSQVVLLALLVPFEKVRMVAKFKTCIVPTSKRMPLLLPGSET
jgi:CRP-like cAMP-binding protein